MNDHEVHEECMRLLRDGLPVPAPAAFEEGRDFLPLGLDMDGDVAVVTFLHQWGTPRPRSSRAGRSIAATASGASWAVPAGRPPPSRWHGARRARWGATC
ncbi:hypothetical protein [Actinomadura madurae]|uniref:hypothetical protein n=1 Tax=Actinomadura madurae TaxID=1993 RepID=UPI0020D24C58|nr:hypothetical protein [Actinomadura madurae]MCQ0014863.1 hypothetical protein [Actinomadura madurae]